MSVYVRYQLDPTGQNPDNYVSGELHTLSNRPVRVIVPRHGPFFSDDSSNLVVYDHITNRVLVKNVDYRVPVISREATLKFGKEIADALLIENQAVSAQVRVSYQSLGGHYQNNIDNIVSIYEAVINDSRNVDWETGVYGKPAAYPPGPHPHWLSEIFGFEPLTFQLERIAQAILLGNAPGYEVIFQSLLKATATKAEIEEGRPLPKWLTLEGLIHTLDKYNFNTIQVTIDPTRLSNGVSAWFDVSSTRIPENEQWFWTIAHETTDVTDFVMNSGLLTMRDGKGRFMIQSARDKHSELDEYFRIEIRRNGVNGMVLYTSPRLTLNRHSSFDRDSLLPAFVNPLMASPRIKVSARTYAANMTVWNQLYQ
jgi:hypothetical protein